MRADRTWPPRTVIRRSSGLRTLESALYRSGLGPVAVGYAVVRLEETGIGRLAVVSDLFVEPDARCVGVGRALMEAVVEWATDSGCHGVDAEVLPGDRSTKNFFEAFGLVARKITVHRSLGERSPDDDRG